jgi:hypothetical protein
MTATTDNASPERDAQVERRIGAFRSEREASRRDFADSDVVAEDGLWEAALGDGFD